MLFRSVTQGNIVKNKMVQVEEPLSNEDVLKLNVLLNTFLQGLSLQDINLALIQTMRDQAGIRQDVLERILEEIAKAIHDADHMEIYTGGATNILKYPELGNPDTATLYGDVFAASFSLCSEIGYPFNL